MEHRQTGRSSRIIDFAVEQLFSVGEVIVTDHVAFEYKNTVKQRALKYFIDKVKKRMVHESYGKYSCLANVKELDGIKLVHFKLKHTISTNSK